MRHKLIQGFILLMIVGTFSCKKLIDIPDTNFIGGDVALSTVANLEQGIIGAYAGTGLSMDILLNSTLSDEVKRGEFYNAATTHEWTFNSSDVSIRDNFTAITPWYKVIDRINRVLKAMPKITPNGAAEIATMNRVKGEALFLRAYSHFELYRYYCGRYNADSLAMPYISEPTLLPAARIKMGEYFSKMEADVNDAKALLPVSLADIARATKYAATGLQARMALYKQDWANAIVYATEYINAIPLATPAQFAAIWTDQGNAEIAFKIPRNIGSLFYGKATLVGGKIKIGTITWSPSDKLYNSFDQVHDIRYQAYLKDEPLLIAEGRPSHLIKKYAGTGYTTSNENVGDAKMFRTGEMYLIRAEAYAETPGNLANAATDLNALRRSRIDNYVDITLPDKATAIQEIMSERFKELAYEGHRFWDLRRKNLPVERLLSDAPTATGGITLPVTDIHWLLPIPQSEMQANKLMVQNPGYAY